MSEKTPQDLWGVYTSLSDATKKHTHLKNEKILTMDAWDNVANTGKNVFRILKKNKVKNKKKVCKGEVHTTPIPPINPSPIEDSLFYQTKVYLPQILLAKFINEAKSVTHIYPWKRVLLHTNLTRYHAAL